MEGVLVLIALLAAVLGYAYRRMVEGYRYWEKKGVPYAKPVPILGSSSPLVNFSKTKGEIYLELCREFRGRPYFGCFDFTTPQLVVADPELAGRIMVKDFGHFVDHGLRIDEESNWIDLSLFNLNGSRWRGVRNKIIPTFTTGKLRGMYETILDCSQHAVRRLEEAGGADVDLKDAMSLYSTEVIASVAFGLDSNKCDDRFRQMGGKALQFTPLRYIKLMLMFSLPKLAKLVGASFTSKEVADYFSAIIKDTLDYRKNTGVVRNDFVQLLLQLKEKGKVEVQTKDADDDYLEYGMSNTTETIEVTERMLIAQAYTFIMAGFEAMSSSLMFILLELCVNPRVQEKARREVSDCLRKHGGFTYQALKEMTYLEMCMQEAMRVRPLVTFLLRECTKKYRLDEGVELEEGTAVVIPVLHFHTDPSYWPEPEEFRPERFEPDAQRVPYAYIPFGDGPRICIGMRFAMLQMKQCTANILKNFKISLSPKTKLPIALNKRTIITAPKHPVWLKFDKITS